MKPVAVETLPPGSRPVVIGRGQPGVMELPGAVCPGDVVLTEWIFSATDLAAILEGGRLRLWTSTFGHPFQPIVIEVVNERGVCAEE